MDKETKYKHMTKKGHGNGKCGCGFIWLLGFIGALSYYLHVHSGTFWLIVLAFLKAIIWPAVLIYHLFLFLKI